MLPPSIHGPLSHSLLILHRMASPHLGLLQHDPLSSQSSSLFIWRSASLLRLAEACACLTVFWLSKSLLAFPPLHILRIFQSLAWVALCTKPSWTPPGLNPCFFPSSSGAFSLWCWLCTYCTTSSLLLQMCPMEQPVFIKFCFCWPPLSTGNLSTSIMEKMLTLTLFARLWRHMCVFFFGSRERLSFDSDLSLDGHV